jgi:hypothetical protein
MQGAAEDDVDGDVMSREEKVEATGVVDEQLGEASWPPCTSDGRPNPSRRRRDIPSASGGVGRIESAKRSYNDKLWEFSYPKPVRARPQQTRSTYLSTPTTNTHCLSVGARLFRALLRNRRVHIVCRTVTKKIWSG